MSDVRLDGPESLQEIVASIAWRAEPVHTANAAGRYAYGNGLRPAFSRSGRERRNPNLRRRVLVVDDCEPLRYLKMQYLLAAGFQVSQADNGNAALRSIEAGCPDLVMLDVNLPDIHGSEVCREVKIRWALPVVFTSTVDIPKELQGTAEGWVMSVDEAALLETVRRALDRGSRRKRRGRMRAEREGAPGLSPRKGCQRKR